MLEFALNAFDVHPEQPLLLVECHRARHQHLIGPVACARAEVGRLSAAATNYRRLGVVQEVSLFPLNRFDAVRINPRSEYVNRR
jgi:hypothetical protein